MTDTWFTILRWTILLAIVGAVVGAPVVYFNHRIDIAHELGVSEGKAECQAEVAKAVEKQAAEDKETMAREAKRAMAAQEEAARQAKLAKDTRKKLDEALAQTPTTPSCFINERATDILRDALDGSFDSSEGSTVSGPFTSGVQPGGHHHEGDQDSPSRHSS